MLIPSIDLRGGRVVQLVQGRREALAYDDVFAWVEQFKTFPCVQLIDLDAAMGRGANTELIAEICKVLPCRVGGGLRTIEAAASALAAGARDIILGSGLFTQDGVNEAFATSVANTCGADRVIAAVDARHGQVVVHGWKLALPITPVEAVKRLEPWCGGVLYTHVDTEGLMRGIDMDAVQAVRGATGHRLAAAGGITTWDEINALDAMQVDAVVGMAVYTGRLPLTPGARGSGSGARDS
jgi:phosphoribosylformimino-5-aminoimidazole carboxamide ribotide isomerase